MSWIVLNSLTVFVIFQLLTFTEQKVVIAEDFENGEDETWLVDDEVSLFLYYVLLRDKNKWGGIFIFIISFCFVGRNINRILVG